MRMTLLEMVQAILQAAESDSVSSIAETIDAENAAAVVRDVYNANVATKKFKEHEQLISLESLSDSTYPNYLKIPNEVSGIKWLQYNKSDTGTNFQVVRWKNPEDFINLVSNRNELSSSFELVAEINSGTFILVQNDKWPDFYTSFDNQNLIFDSYKKSVDTTLMGNKSRAFVKKLPVFTFTDSFVPDINDYEFPYLLTEAKSTFMSLYKTTVDPKTEQMARRLKNFRQNEEKIREGSRVPNFGR